MKQGEEFYIQKDCVLWFRANYKNYLIFSVPSEATHNNVNYYKGLGLISGVSDTIVVLPNKVLFVEFKSSAGRQSQPQKEFQHTIESLGYEYHLIRSVEAFKELIKKQKIN